jgi:hypothetical protein
MRRGGSRRISPSWRGCCDEERLQFIIFMAFGAFCFGSGVLTAFIVTRNKWRDEMIKRGVARYNSRTGKWEWGEPPNEPGTWKVQ